MSGYQSLEPREKAIFLMKKGIPISEVCLQLNIERSLVLTWGWEAEIDVIKKDWDFLKKEAISLMSERASVNEVARRLAIPRSTVSSWKKKAGITVYSQSTKMKSEMYGAVSWYEPPPPVKRKPQKTQSSGNSGWATSGKKEKALTMLREGTSQKEIRRRLGVNNKSLKKWMREAELTAKSGRAKNKPHHSTTPHSPEIKEKALQMIRDGATLREVEGRLKISYHTIYAWMRKAGLSTKSGRAKTFRGAMCRVCQTYLDGNNSYPSLVTKANYICKECHKKQVRERKKYVSGGTSTLEKPPPVKTRPTPNIRLNAMQMVLEGLTDKEVALKTGVHVRTVGKWKKKAGLTKGKRVRNPGRKTSPLKEEGLQMIRDGISGAEVARRLGVHKGTVRNWRKAAGLSGKSGQSPGRKTSELKEEGLQMIQDGISGAEVARRLGVHKSTVSNWRKSAGLSGVDGREYHSVEQENNVIDLLRDGKSQVEVSRITGIRAKKISAWKKQAEKEGFL